MTPTLPDGGNFTGHWEVCKCNLSRTWMRIQTHSNSTIQHSTAHTHVRFTQDSAASILYGSRSSNSNHITSITSNRSSKIKSPNRGSNRDGSNISSTSSNRRRSSRRRRRNSRRCAREPIVRLGSLVCPLSSRCVLLLCCILQLCCFATLLLCCCAALWIIPIKFCCFAMLCHLFGCVLLCPRILCVW